MAATTYPAIAAGQRITGTLLTSMLPQFILKTADESVTSSTALQNDDDFAFTVAASASYVLDAYLMINGAPTGTGDFKLDFTVPTSATMKYTSFGVTTSSAIQYEDTVNANSTARPVGTNGATDMGVALRAFVITSSTAGTVQMRWAQNTSSGTATIVRANSWMRLTRIA